MLTHAVTGRPANEGDIRCAWPHVRRHSGANGDEEAGKKEGGANKGNPADRRTYRCESADCERTVEIWTRREYSFILQLRFPCKSADCEWTVEFQKKREYSFISQLRFLPPIPPICWIIRPHRPGGPALARLDPVCLTMTCGSFYSSSKVSYLPH